MPYMTWEVFTNNTSSVYEGEPGHSYAFYSIARDGVGHVEDAPEEPDAIVIISASAPIAGFTYTPEDPRVGESVSFNASSSYDPDGGGIENYEWNFGDGNITDTTDLVITHSYSSAGDYTVNLTVTDDEGATNSTIKIIQVSKKGDFDTDGDIDWYDFLDFIDVYGLSLGDPGYNAVGDFDVDDDIDWYDFLEFIDVYET